MMKNPRDTYLAASVATASPAQLLVMLYERLSLDLQRATASLAAGDPAERARAAAARPGHRPRAARLAAPATPGPAARRWRRSTTTCIRQLVAANIHKDLETAEHCLGLVNDLARHLAAGRRLARPGAAHDDAAGRGPPAPRLGGRARPARARPRCGRSGCCTTTAPAPSTPPPSTTGTSRTSTARCPTTCYDRAVELRARQESLQAALAARLGTIRREHAFAARVDGRPAGPPAAASGRSTSTSTPDPTGTWPDRTTPLVRSATSTLG